ncbi:MAG: hypothetical protein A2233_04630 [Candidatus Kerfeldbacteria bacterium RIFOXYA2_FULL_38_24]|uniref:Cell shape determination protein CcmA n=1 Tax=Candidatus Kerfeldbacteria bacterium RIFOXYB2_FULL_38_14 TaxID=1798547 RepID=A0A1G2BIF7_9BACT|nr:MAG: hypothetical protein A2319_02450 [Candidatus Kerfeldbacteria bacterium RIFOXYB2_FULL_38_14]OGY88157.1 MAG: hypothetical protein A2233_04630 [Candidatus Kerfeldbacteria bacterium RIFOXYA2_FULL_38_24]OGY89224.1 MAG: hypothetical protein A2458_01105 [Candidatus Kerfeldbacteria bacterium RIFOXYC2_FULL_38_9]
MFSKNTEEQNFKPAAPGETVIGQTVRVEGTFESEDDMQLDGVIKGNVKTTKDITVGKEAKIEAEMQAANMSVSGEIKGNITVSGTLKLFPSAKIYGDITTGVLSVESGALLQGQCKTEGTEVKIDSEKTETSVSEA